MSEGKSLREHYWVGHAQQEGTQDQSHFWTYYIDHEKCEKGRKERNTKERIQFASRWAWYEWEYEPEKSAGDPIDRTVFGCTLFGTIVAHDGVGSNPAPIGGFHPNHEHKYEAN